MNLNYRMEKRAYGLHRLENFADRFYLSLWFPSISESEMLPRLTAVVKHFPFAESTRGFTRMAAYALDWNEAIVLEQFFDVESEPNAAIALAAEILHDDYAYQFDSNWDLWVPEGDDSADRWAVEPVPVQLVLRGTAFDDEIYKLHGHIMLDLGLTGPFVFEGASVTESAKEHVRANIEKLIAFTGAVQKHCGLTGRLLWSETENTLAQQLVQRLQQVQ